MKKQSNPKDCFYDKCKDYNKSNMSNCSKHGGSARAKCSEFVYAETAKEERSMLFNNASGSVLERVLLVAESMIGDPVEDDLQKFVNWMRENFKIPKNR